jgi:DNA-binding CsgD family transcriptional regulator
VEPQGFVDTAVVNLDKTETSFAALVVRRSAREGLIDDAARRRLARIAPHVRRAILVGKAVHFHESRSSQLAETLSKLAAAIFLLSAEGRVVFANDSAQELLRRGQFLKEGNRRLFATNATADVSLRTAIAAAARGDEALGTGGLAIELVAPPGERWLAHVLPMTEGTRSTAARAYSASVAVFVRKASLDLQWPLDAIGKLHGLTPMETRVLQGIVEIGGVPAIAEKLGISEGTVRTHLKSVYAKTGIQRQADLIKLIASHASPFGS